jgi:hypothetical protein
MTVESRESFDEAAAHVHFSKACFNRAWTLIEKPDRSAADDEAMILTSQASLWHWSQRSDCGDLQWSIGYWQASRIRALLGHGDEAMRYARLCLDHSGKLPAFYQAAAYEALARAAKVGGDHAAARAHAARARELADAVDDPEDREIIDADLATLA